MPRKVICLVCGCGEDEAEKFHYFPRNDARCKAWLDSLGYLSFVGEMKHARICNKHFSNDSYIPHRKWALYKDAVPMSFFEALPQASKEAEVDVTEAGPSTSTDVAEAGPSTSTDVDVVEIFPNEPTTGSVVPSKQATSTKARMRIYQGIPNLSIADATPRKKRLIWQLESKAAQIRQLKRVCLKKKNTIKALSNFTDTGAVRRLFSGMSKGTTDFLLSQLQSSQKRPKGRRWSLQDKVIALALFKKGPRSYSFLRKLLPMPSKRTLLSILAKVPFTSGINEHLFNHINCCLSTSEDRLCMLLFDEMDIKENLEYDKSEDRIVGFEDRGNKRTNKVANRALVFMCVGLGPRRWKQPVAFYFSQNGCSSEDLQYCLQEVVTACHAIAKLNVVGTICDMGSSNVKMLKDMGSCIERPYIQVQGKKIFTMYDPPHLLKCTVSLFRRYKMILPVEIGGERQKMEADFKHIVSAYLKDKASPLIFRHLKKIKEEHLAPKMRFAMKVSVAANLMSHTVAAYLYTLISQGYLEQQALATATFVQQVDELFDSFNGRSPVQAREGGKPLKCHISNNSPHIVYWKKAFEMIQQWQFKRVTKAGQMRAKLPPSQIGWLISLHAIQEIWSVLRSNEFNSLRPRSLNQDALENLFGCIRGNCGSSDNPTVVQFRGSLKTSILNNLTNQAMSGNCEDDDHFILSNLQEFLNVGEKVKPVIRPSGGAENADPPVLSSNVADSIASAVRLGHSEALSVAYVSGFIVKKLLEITSDCQQCLHDLLSSDQQPHNLFITFKEWSTKEQHLIYPSQTVVIAVGHAITVLENILQKNPEVSCISEACIGAINKDVQFAFNCEIHKEMLIYHCITSVCRIGIPWWCTRQNRERKDGRAVKRKMQKFSSK